MKIKKNDIVKMLSGKDRGKTGKVIKIAPKTNSILVENLNLVKKRVRPKKMGQKGEIVLISRFVPVSKAMLICPNCKEAARVGIRLEGNSRVRYCKKCQSQI